jgi:hypothetical protein
MYYSFKIHFNIILPYISRSPKQILPFRFSDKNFVCMSDLYNSYVLRAHLILSDLFTSETEIGGLDSSGL